MEGTMKIIVACKILPDSQDVQIMADGALDCSKAHQVVSDYDLNAIEAAVQLAAADEGSTVVAVSAGDKKIDDSKVKKGVLARGVDELYLAADDALADMDARATAATLADLIAEAGEFDVVVCGDGSADNYAQQVDVQLAAKLGLPVVTAAAKITARDGVLEVERMLEDVVEVVEVPLPAVVSVVPDIAAPSIPGMKDILAAGKKPMHVTDVDAPCENAVETVSILAPEQVQRKVEILDASEDGAIEQFVAALKSAL